MIVSCGCVTVLTASDTSDTLTWSWYFRRRYMPEASHYPQEDHTEDAMNFGQFYADQIRDLSRFIARRVPHPQDAQDIVAETMCVFLDSCRRRPEVRHYRALLYLTAKHRIADYYAARAKRFREMPLDASPQIPARGSLLRDAEVHEELTQVMDAMGGLREEDREILSLSATIGLSAQEIAVIMETSQGAIRVRLHFARKKLKRLLKGQQHGNPMDQPTD